MVQDKRPVETIESYAKRYDPRKALFYSAVLPGMGQAYNKKYWKIPLVYGGFGVLISVAATYNELYTADREDYFSLINDPSNPQLSPGGLTQDQLTNRMNTYRRERDFFIILNCFWYIIQLVDAHVDSHLKEFELNPKLQVRIEPMIENSMQLGRSTGIALKLRF